MTPGETIRLSWEWTEHDGKELDLVIDHVVTEEDVDGWNHYVGDGWIGLDETDWLESKWFDFYREEAAQKWQELQS